MAGRVGARVARWIMAVSLMGLVLGGPGVALAAPPEQAADAPEVGARAAIVVEYPSGRILYNKTMHDRLAPASTTKVLTAILAIEHGNLDQSVTAAPEDLVGESSMGLVAGEQQTMHNLLYGMLLPSGNDAAMAIARYLGSQEGGVGSAGSMDRFTQMMNARVAQLGLTDSHFVNPHGLDDPDHYSSAYDLASFTWYALHLPVFDEIVAQPFYEAPGHPLRNTNEMLSRYPGADGVKTGWTDAGGLCLVTSATRDGHRLISVVLNAPHWYTDSGALLDYGFAKLAIAPEAPGDEVLSVAGRGAASWMLASATSTPPLTPVSELKQGGGVASQAANSADASSNSGAPVAAPALGAGGPALAGVSVAAAPVPVVSIAGTSGRGFSPAVLLWGAVLLVAALLAAAGFSLLRGRAVATAALAGAPVGGVPADPGERLQSRSPLAPYRPPARGPAVHTLGSAPETRRREPNLLLTADEAGMIHLNRAVALAQEGRQGSSMSEFLLAIRLGISVDARQLDGAAPLNSAAYISLARALDAAGRHDDAVATLEHGVDALPGDRMLHLALRQLRSH